MGLIEDNGLEEGKARGMEQLGGGCSHPREIQWCLGLGWRPQT